MKEMFKNGIGEDAEFAGYHPVVNFIFFVFAIGITMFSIDPVFLVVTLSFSWAWSILLNGKKAVRFNLLMTIPVMIVMAVINTLFTHNGATVLFYLNYNRVTLEAFVYGLAAAVMISSVIIWFTCFNKVMTSDKFIYLFGKAAPVLGLTLSMIFRFIPLLKSRYNEISMGQKCMGRHVEKGIFAKARQLIKEASILVSWSLEASIETSDSMEARGYGLHGRSSFHLFKFTSRDKKFTAYILATGIIASVGCALGKTSIYYYPVIDLGNWDLMKMITLISYILLLVAPLVIDVLGEKKWQAYRSEI